MEGQARDASTQATHPGEGGIQQQVRGGPAEPSSAKEALKRRTECLVEALKPSQLALQRRLGLFQAVAKVLNETFDADARVTMFGSVPLKTFLPGGDLDVCILGASPSLASGHWAERVRGALEAEGRRTGFVLSDMQVINAEVKVLKCLISGIMVDISVNQLGGLGALGFLEEVDRFIGKDHLFKRSVILIKAWCFYEGRLLGAHHGLISTYGLETLVMYIFNVFHAELDSPLQVLFRFLSFFASFDWDAYALSLRGPIPLENLAGSGATVYEPHARDGFLFDRDEFLRHVQGKYGSVLYGGDWNTNRGRDRPFQVKHMNIVDPLRSNNNLGRSVSRANFIRIRRALRVGTHRLAKALQATSEDAAYELFETFFRNTSRHRREWWESDPMPPDLSDSRASSPRSKHYLRAEGPIPKAAESPLRAPAEASSESSNGGEASSVSDEDQRPSSTSRMGEVPRSLSVDIRRSNDHPATSAVQEVLTDAHNNRRPPGNVVGPTSSAPPRVNSEPWEGMGTHHRRRRSVDPLTEKPLEPSSPTGRILPAEESTSERVPFDKEDGDDLLAGDLETTVLHLREGIWTHQRLQGEEGSALPSLPNGSQRRPPPPSRKAKGNNQGKGRPKGTSEAGESQNPNQNTKRGKGRGNPGHWRQRGAQKQHNDPGGKATPDHHQRESQHHRQEQGKRGLKGPNEAEEVDVFDWADFPPLASSSSKPPAQRPMASAPFAEKLKSQGYHDGAGKHHEQQETLN